MRTLFAIICIVAVTDASPSRAVADTAHGFDVTIRGDSQFTFGLVHQSNDVGASMHDFANRARITITPNVTTDDGLTYGARFRFRASLGTGLTDADQGYLFFRGGFGTVEFGSQFNPMALYHIIAPSNFGTGGIDGDWAFGDAGWIQNQPTFLEPYASGGYTVTTFTKNANRVNYLTPRFLSNGSPEGGLMGTVSFAPVNRGVFSNVVRSSINTTASGNHPYGYGKTSAYSNCGGGTSPVGCNYRNIVEFGLRYDGKISDFPVQWNAAYSRGDTDLTNYGTVQSFYGLSAWQVGIQFELYGLKIGGSYANAGRSAYPVESQATGSLYYESQYTWTAGISFGIGPVSIGFNTEFGHDAGDLTAPGARNAMLYSTGLTWNLAPGLTTAIEYLWSRTRNEAGFVRDPLGFSRAASGNGTMALWKTEVKF